MSYFIFILIYLLQAYLIFLVARKLREKTAVFAWMPVANDYLITRLAKKPFYWLILMYIPLLNIYYDFILWREIFKRFERNFFYAILMLIPIVNWLGLVLLAYLFVNPDDIKDADKAGRKEEPVVEVLKDVPAPETGKTDQPK